MVKEEREEQRRCTAVIASGKNKGTVCNRAIGVGERFCRYHVKCCGEDRKEEKEVEEDRKEEKEQQVERKEEDEKKEEEDRKEEQDVGSNGFDENKFINDLTTLAGLMKPLSDWLETQRVFTRALINNNNNNNFDK